MTRGRSGKSAAEWTSNDLRSWKIKVVDQKTADFFGTANLPPAPLNHELLTTLSSVDATQNTTYAFLSGIEQAMSEDSAVSDFLVTLLRVIGYADKGVILRTRKDIPFLSNRETKKVTSDLCLIDGVKNQMILLVQEDTGTGDAEAQLIAQAIAAFTYNNQMLRSASSHPTFMKDMAGIIIRGTSPIFYKIPIRFTLPNAVASGNRSDYERDTIVFAHYPNIPRPGRRWDEGMQPVDNRQIIFSCFEAFKRFVQ